MYIYKYCKIILAMVILSIHNYIDKIMYNAIYIKLLVLFIYEKLNLISLDIF